MKKAFATARSRTLSRAQFSQRGLRPLRLALKHAHRVALSQQFARQVVVQRDIFESKIRVVVSSHQCCGVRHHGQRPNPQQINLGQPQLLDVAVLVLGDEESLGRQLDRRIIGQWAGRDHNAAGVQAQVIGLPDQPVSTANNLPLDRILNRRQHIFHRAPVATPRVGVPLPWRKRSQPVDLIAR